MNSGKYCLVKNVIHDPLCFIVYSGKHKKNKVLHRGKHDTTAACWQGKVEQVQIKRKNGHCILDICLDLLFQVLNTGMPSKYAKFSIWVIFIPFFEIK